ncbi:MAG: UDP-N-acetylmuramoyl-L-alanyl-D-glutamate--2,6-diaminopimelate ligase [Gammaproteobacteria bacterium]
MPARQKTSTAWQVSVLLEGFATELSGPDTQVTGVNLDSRLVERGDLFLAAKGESCHGLRHLCEALEKGAAAVAWEPHHNVTPPDCPVPLVVVPDLARRAGAIASRFHQHPSADMTLIGITGTDGKTSVSHFVAQALDKSEARCGVIGTLGWGFPGALQDTIHTTPDGVSLQHTLDALRAQRATHVAMEVSSHGLAQGRVSGAQFDIAVLTNLSRDHLDYHGDLNAYAAAKRSLFETAGLRHAVLNADDAFGRQVAHALAADVGLIRYGLDASDEGLITARNIELTATGLCFDVHTPHGGAPLNTPLIGRFNVHNLLAAFSCLLALGLPFAEALERMSRVRPVPGRIEVVSGERDPIVVVDYAHTPAALDHVLRALREHCTERLWCVFGCGGDRDAGKRPEMAKVASRHADHVIVTDDNPRSESPAAIVVDILAGFRNSSQVTVVHDRAAAIGAALTGAEPGDIVLVAGKGHESVQIVGDERRTFRDSDCVRTMLELQA